MPTSAKVQPKANFWRFLFGSLVGARFGSFFGQMLQGVPEFQRRGVGVSQEREIIIEEIEEKQQS